MSIQFNGAGSLKKTLSVLTSMATVLSLSGFAALAPLATSAAAPSDYGLKEGDTISAAGSDDPDVYIVNQQGYKRLFLNPVIFSFYGHLGGFANVKNVTPAVRDAFPTSGLFRNCETNDPKVYGVEVNGEDTAVLHWVNTSGAQAVADDPNFFSKVFCINNNEFNWYAKGSDYTSVNQVPNYSRQPGQTTTPTGPLSAGLAADNPASGTLVAEQALADLAHFSVNGSGTVTSVQLKRLGVSGDSTLSNVFLFVNGARVSDSGNVSSGMITFNNAAGLFTAPATLVVKSDILTGTSGQTVGVQLTGLNGQSVSASGNLFTIASTPSLASVTIGSVTGPGDFDPQADVNVLSANSFQVSNEDVYLRRLTVREIGSVNNTDVRNLRLLVDGVQVGSAAGLDADGYATFVTNQRVTTGSHTLKVVADVVGGSGRTMQFSIRGAYDIEVVDEAYNVGVKATDTFPVTVSVASTVGQASVTVVKATNSPSGDVVDEALDVPLARFTLTGYGEATKIDSLGFRASVSDAGISGLSGGRVLIDGTQYGSTTNFSTTATTSFSVNYTLQPGTSVTVEVRADMKEQSNGTDVSSGDKISVLFDGGDLNNGQGVSSANLVDVPTSTLEGNNLSVVQGSLTLSKATNYPDQNITPPQSAYKIGQWTVTGSSAESININTFTVTIDAEDGTTFDNTDLTNMYLKYGTTQTSPKGTVNASNDFSVTRTLAANEVMTVELYATIGSNITTGDSMRASLAIGATTASGANANQGATPGQEIDTQAGIFSTSVDTGSPKLVLSASAVSAGTWRFRGENDNFSLTELRFKVASASDEQLAVASVDLKDNGVVVQSKPLVLVGDDYVATFTGLNIPVGTEKVLTADVNTADVTTTVTTGKNVGLTLDYVKYKSDSVSETTDNTDRTGSALYVHDAIPSLTQTALSSGTFTTGFQDLARFTITPSNGPGGSVAVNQIRFDISKSSGVRLASASASDLRLYINGGDVTPASVSHSGLGSASTSGYVIFEFPTEVVLSGATTVAFRGNVDLGDGTDTLTVSMHQDTTKTGPADAETAGASSASLVWSDRSASSHSATTSDWMDSYLLQGLPMSWGLSRN